MPEKPDENNSVTMIDTFKLLIPYLPTLLFRIPGTIFHIKRMAKHGGAVFHKELIEQGIDKDIAQKLTNSYLETSNFKTYLGLFK
jgi:hypothetical protein